MLDVKHISMLVFIQGHDSYENLFENLERIAKDFKRKREDSTND